MAYISEALLYLCYALILGSLLVKAIPEGYRPTVTVPWTVPLIAAAGIPILSFVPVYTITKFYQDAFQTDFLTIFKDVLVDVNVGTSWLWILGLSLALLLLLSVPVFRGDKATPYVGLILLFALIICLGWGSHTKAFYHWPGFLIHTIHFFAVMVWIGLMIVVAWFSKNQNNWSIFLKWFSPLSVGCVIVAITAGIILMAYLTPDYVNSWMVPYGQALLIKHILIIPLLVMGFVNGFLLPRQIKINPQLNLISWIKAESVLAFFVFIATAVMGQQDPPHDVKLYLEEAPPSPLFTALYQGEFNPGMSVTFTIHPLGLLLAACSLLLLLSLVFLKKRKVQLSMLGSVLFILSTYFSIMLSIR